MHTALSVNINKYATLRNSRGGNLPNILKIAQDCERFGAQGITMHPRPDERHIRYADVYNLKPIVTTELNIEGYPSEAFLKMVLEIKPQQCTLVPDADTVLTSNQGWDTVKNNSFLTPIAAQLQSEGIRVSLFINPEVAMVHGAAKIGAKRIEIYTGDYAHHFETLTTEAERQKLIAPYVATAEAALKNGLAVNAGHDLNLHNLRYFKQQIPQLAEVSIGHALICDAIYYGLENTINMYKRQLSE